jgi:hypothetical protein
MVKVFAERLMAAGVDALCGAGYGEVTPERTNSRNGLRHRDFDTGWAPSMNPATQEQRALISPEQLPLDLPLTTRFALVTPSREKGRRRQCVRIVHDERREQLSLAVGLEQPLCERKYRRG